MHLEDELLDPVEPNADGMLHDDDPRPDSVAIAADAPRRALPWQLLLRHRPLRPQAATSQPLRRGRYVSIAVTPRP